VSDVQVTRRLALEAMGWRHAPGRYLKQGRAWIPDWRFQPFKNTADAFQLLAATGAKYTISWNGEAFAVEVRLSASKGAANDSSCARAMTLAVAHAFNIEGAR
jgi:hypothetical protein